MAIDPVIKHYFDVLGLKPTTSQTEIRKAYKSKSKLLHPDKRGREGEAAFKMIVHACEALCEHELRPVDIQEAEGGDTGSGPASDSHPSADAQELFRERDSLEQVVAQQAVVIRNQARKIQEQAAEIAALLAAAGAASRDKVDDLQIRLATQSRNMKRIELQYEELKRQSQVQVSIHQLEIDAVRNASRDEMQLLQKKLDVQHSNMKAEMSRFKWSYTAKIILGSLLLLATIWIFQQYRHANNIALLQDQHDFDISIVLEDAGTKMQTQQDAYEAWIIPSPTQYMPSSTSFSGKSARDTKADDIDHEAGSKSGASSFETYTLQQNPVSGLVNNLLMPALTFVGSFAQIQSPDPLHLDSRKDWTTNHDQCIAQIKGSYGSAKKPAHREHDNQQRRLERRLRSCDLLGKT